MDNNEKEFELDDILKEFGGGMTEESEELISQETLAEVFAAEPAKETASNTEIPSDTIRLERIADARSKAPEAEPAEEEQTEAAAETEPEVEDDETKAIPVAEVQEEVAEPAPVEEKPLQEVKPPIVYDPRARIRELKRKLVAGPEKRYYDLMEIGVGKLQLAILVNLLIVGLCIAATSMFVGGMIPENRMRLLIFSQVLAMGISALLASFNLIEGVADLFKLRFSLNTMMFFTSIACVVDAVFCLQELRVPCCAAFCLEATFALWQRYEQRNTEMGQMDTMRKAVRLHSVVKVPDFYNGRPGLLRGQGEVEDFMDNYNQTTGPERVQMIYTFVSFLACIGIAAFAYLRSGASMAVQVLSTSLLVATPASFFVSLTRPMAILERRLHMVGTVLCGWKGVRKLCGKAAFPLNDDDLFPTGSTKLNGVKFYGDRNPDQVVAYATALIRAGGGGLEPIFNQLLKSRSGGEYKVENFQRYPSGGIGGEVWGESVLMGTIDFLQDMGVEIPEGTMVNQAVYCSIDGQLGAVFAISYARMKSSAAGMVTLCAQRRLTPVLTSGDFMLTDVFLKTKFGVRTKRMAFPTYDERKVLAARKPDENDQALALTTQDGLSATAYAVTGARALRTACRMGLAVHIFGGILGMLIMLALAYLGAREELNPIRVLLYQVVWMIPGLLITEWTRTV
jgi:hypothetical protein